jgi:hypothetical protein
VFDHAPYQIMMNEGAEGRPLVWLVEMEDQDVAVTAKRIPTGFCVQSSSTKLVCTAPWVSKTLFPSCFLRESSQTVSGQQL